MPSQWDSVHISLASLVGFSEVHFAVVFTSGWGNNLFLDNIQVKDAVGVNLPQPVSIRSSDSTICPWTVVIFDDQSPEFPTSWSWTFEGGTPETSNLQNPSIQYYTPGQYDVILTVGNAIGEVNDTFTTFIEVIGKPTVSIAADNDTLCPGEEVTFIAGGALNYIWYDERSIDPMSVESTYTTRFFQNRNVYLSGSNINGCADTTSIFIELEESANISVTPSDTVICEGETVLLTASGGESYIWLSKNDTLSTGTTLELTYTSSSVIGLMGTQAGVCSGFNKAIIRVDIPLAEITIDGNTLTASAGESYQWFIGGEVIAGATSQTYTALSYGTYTVLVTSEYNCSSLSEAALVNSIEDTDDLMNISIYPNPTSGKFFISASGSENGSYKYELIDIHGKLILKEEFVKTQEIFNQEINFIGKPGLYFLRINNGLTSQVIKIIKI